MKVRPKSALYFFILFGSAKIVVAEEKNQIFEPYIEEINQNSTKTFDAATNEAEIEKPAISRKVFNIAKIHKNTPISTAQPNKSDVEIRSNKNVNVSLQNRVILNSDDSHSKVEITSKQDRTGNEGTSTFPFKLGVEQKLEKYGRSNQLERSMNAPKYENGNPSTNQPIREVVSITKDTRSSPLEGSIVIDNNALKKKVKENLPIVRGLGPKYQDIIGIENKSPYSDIKNNFKRMTNSETQFDRGTTESTYADIESKSFRDDTVSENLNKDNDSDEEDAKNKKIVDALLKSNSFVKQLSHLLRQMVLSAHLNVPTIPDNKTSTSCIQTDNITIIQTASKQDTSQLQEENKKLETNLTYLKENVAKLENQLEDYRTRLVLLENHVSNSKQNKEDFDKNILKLFKEQNLKIIKDNENLKNTIKILELNITNLENKFELSIKNQSEENKKQIDQINDKLKSFEELLIKTTKKGNKHPTEDSNKMSNEDVDTLIRKTVKTTLKNLLKKIKTYIENGEQFTNENIDNKYGTSSEEAPLTKPNSKPSWYVHWAQEFAKHKSLLGQKQIQINTRMSNPTAKYINIKENRTKNLKVDYEDPSERNRNSELEVNHPRNKINGGFTTVNTGSNENINKKGAKTEIQPENSHAIIENNKEGSKNIKSDKLETPDNININIKKQEANNEINNKNPEKLNHHNKHKSNIERYEDNNKDIRQNGKDDESTNKGYIDRSPKKINYDIDKNRGASQNDKVIVNKTENTLQIPNKNPDEIENSGNKENNDSSKKNEDTLGHYKDQFKTTNVDPKKIEISYDKNNNKYSSQKNKETASSNKDELKLLNMDPQTLKPSNDTEKIRDTSKKENQSYDKDKLNIPIRDFKPLKDSDNKDKNESIQKNIATNKNKSKIPDTHPAKIETSDDGDKNQDTGLKTKHHASHNKDKLKIPNLDPEKTENSANRDKNRDTSHKNKEIVSHNKDKSKLSNVDPEKIKHSYNRDKNKDTSQKNKENIGHIDKLKIPKMDLDKMETSYDRNEDEDTIPKSEENTREKTKEIVGHNLDQLKIPNMYPDKKKIFHSKDTNRDTSQKYKENVSHNKNKSKVPNNETKKVDHSHDIDKNTYTSQQNKENIGQDKDELKIPNKNREKQENPHARNKNKSKNQEDVKDINGKQDKSKLLNIQPEKMEHHHHKSQINDKQYEDKEYVSNKNDAKVLNISSVKSETSLDKTKNKISDPEENDHSQYIDKKKVKTKEDKEYLNKHKELFLDLKKIEDSRKRDKENENNSKDKTEIIILNPEKVEHSSDKYKNKNKTQHHKGKADDDYNKAKLPNINAGNINISTKHKDEYIKDKNQEHYSSLTGSISDNKEVTEANYLKKQKKSDNNAKKNINLNQTEQENLSNYREYNELPNINSTKINDTDYDSLINKKKESLQDFNKFINLNSGDTKIPDNGNYKAISNPLDTESSLRNNSSIKKYIQLMKQLKMQKDETENIKLGKKEGDERPHITNIDKDHPKRLNDDDISLLSSNLGNIYSSIQKHISQIKKHIIRPEDSVIYNLDPSEDEFPYISKDDYTNLDKINFMNQYYIPQKIQYNLNHHAEPNEPNYLSKNNKRPQNTNIFQNHRKEPIESSLLYKNEPGQKSSNTRPKNKNIEINHHQEPKKNKPEQINLDKRTNPRYTNSENRYEEPNGRTQADTILDNLNIFNKKYFPKNNDIGITQYKEVTTGGFPDNLNFMNNKYVPQIPEHANIINMNRYKEPTFNSSSSLRPHAHLNSDEFHSGNSNYKSEINQNPFNIRGSKNFKERKNSNTKALTFNIPATDKEQYTENPLEISGIIYTENLTNIRGLKDFDDKDIDAYEPATLYTNSAGSITDKDQNNENPIDIKGFKDFNSEENISIENNSKEYISEENNSKDNNSKEDIINEDDEPDINVFKKTDNLLFAKSLGSGDFIKNKHKNIVDNFNKKNKDVQDYLSTQNGNPKPTKLYDNYVFKSVHPNKNKHMKTDTIANNYREKNKYINSNDNPLGHKDYVYDEYDTKEVNNYDYENLNHDNHNTKQTIDLKYDTHEEPEELDQDHNSKNTTKYHGKEHNVPNGLKKYGTGNKNDDIKIINPKHNNKVKFDSDYYNTDNIKNFNNIVSQDAKRKQEKTDNYQIYAAKSDNSIKPIYNYQDYQEIDEKPKIKSKRHYKNSKRSKKKKKNKRRKHGKNKKKVKSTHTIQRPNLKAERNLPSLKFVISNS